MPISIATLCGSVRADNFTAKALALVHDELGRQPDVVLTKVDLMDYDLPLPGRSGKPGEVDRFRAALRDQQALVLATPEYHGSFSSAIKLAIENMGFPSALAGKPVALLGVAAGRIGAIKSLEHLRSVCSHVGAMVLPTLVSVANVDKVFAADGTCRDPEIEKQIRHLAHALLDYIHTAVCPRFTLEAMLRGQVPAATDDATASHPRS